MKAIWSWFRCWILDAVSPGCNLSCSDPDTGPCVSVEKCRCTRTEDDSGCTVGQSSDPRWVGHLWTDCIRCIFTREGNVELFWNHFHTSVRELFGKCFCVWSFQCVPIFISKREGDDWHFFIRHNWWQGAYQSTYMTCWWILCWRISGRFPPDGEILPDDEDVVSRHGFSHNGDILKYGSWKYFRFEVGLSFLTWYRSFQEHFLSIAENDRLALVNLVIGMLLVPLADQGKVSHVWWRHKSHNHHLENYKNNRKRNCDFNVEMSTELRSIEVGN